MHTISAEASKNTKGGDKMNESQLHEQITEVSKTIFSFCLTKTSNRQDAEDLSQDIILELFKSVNNIRDDKAFYGFMWAVAENVYKQWYKKKLKTKTCELTDDIANTLVDFEPENNSDIYLLRRELSLLSEKYRKATILYYIDGDNCHQIADKLNLSESMVKYLLFKSRKILKEGMNMERKLGELSYNPKNLIPLYNGSGPNRFCDFMNHKMRQNIVSACYNDSLTAQQISLETGIPLPYVDDELKALVDKAIIIKDGTHYKANVIVITTESTEEIRRNVGIYHEKLADSISEFLNKHLGDFKKIGFVGNDFSDNSLRWQLMTYVLAAITLYNTDVLNTNDASCFPKTAWGDNAYIWLVEYNDMSKDELRDLDWVSWIDFTGYTPALHRADWEYMCTTLFSTGDLQDVILDMIDHFMDGTGTSYSNSTLTQKAYEHDSTQSYISAVESKLTTLLNTYDGDISALEYFASTRESNPFVQALKGTNQPVYNTIADKVNGLTICVDGLWGNKIEVTSYNLSGNTYTYTLHYTLYDHFGLDQNDVEKYGPLAGFRSWYVLQHYNEYNGAYRPFLTMIEFDVTVSGTYS